IVRRGFGRPPGLRLRPRCCHRFELLHDRSHKVGLEGIQRYEVAKELFPFCLGDDLSKLRDRLVRAVVSETEACSISSQEGSLLRTEREALGRGRDVAVWPSSEVPSLGARHRGQELQSENSQIVVAWARSSEGHLPLPCLHDDRRSSFAHSDLV